MEENSHNYKRLARLVSKRMAISDLLKSQSPHLHDFNAFWEVATELAHTLEDMGQAKLARQSMLLIFRSWCEWAHGNYYGSQVRESLRLSLPNRFEALERMSFMKLSADERLDLFYLMSPYEWALLKIS